MFLRNILYSSLIFSCCTESSAQTISVDSVGDNNSITDSTVRKPKEKHYHVGGGRTLIYQKPKTFSFITNLPRDAAGIARSPFRKKSIKPVVLVAASTALLLFADQTVADGVRQFSSNIHLHPEEDYTDIISIKMGDKDVSLLKAPDNLNTAIYQLGQGFPSLLLGAGMYVYGKIYRDYRSESTALQLAESFILMGAYTQVVKRITGRQSPSHATSNGGNWNFFPSFKDYQNNTPYYDAFPSGHLATLMSTVTILAENYPERKWIKPVGYTLTGLVGFSMINNSVHWISDYPLAIALGYLCAKQVVKNSRREVQGSVAGRKKASLSYTFNYVGGKFLPGVVYKF